MSKGLLMDNQLFWNANWAKWSHDFTPSPFAVKALKLIKIKDFHDVLDLGCGTGGNSLFFAANGLNVTACDVSDAALDAVDGLKHPKIKTMQADMTTANFGKEKYDAVFACLSLHYFDDAVTRRIVSNIRESLRADGALFVRCKSTEDPLYGKGEQVGKDMYRFGYVRHFFSPEYMRDVLSAFPVVRITETREDYFGDCAFVDAAAMKQSA